MTLATHRNALVSEKVAISRGLSLALMLAGAIVAFSGYFIQIIDLFYRTGAYFWDTGWYAYIMSIASFPPRNPPVFLDQDTPYYFQMHIAPIMSLWGTASSLFGLAPGVSFAIFQGVVHAGLFLMGFHWLRRDEGGRNAVLATFLGLLFAFNPFTLAAISYPHTEVALPVLILAVAFLAGRRWWIATAIAFLLLLSVRGDSGFHLACFTWTYAIAEAITRRGLSPSVRLAALLGAVAFAYSVGAFLFQNAFFPGFDNLGLVYVGDNFSHLSLALYGERLMNLVANRPELLVFWLAPMIWGAVRRDFTVFAGAGAVLPWFVFNLSAVRGPPSELFTYYAFPFLVCFFWPLFVHALRQSRGEALAPTATARLTYPFYAVAGLLALVLYVALPFGGDSGARHARLHFISTFLPRVDAGDFAAARASTAILTSSLASGQPTFADDGVMSLNPEIIVTKNRVQSMAPVVEAGQPWMIVYFATYLQVLDIQALTDAQPMTCRELPDSYMRVRYSNNYAVPAEMERALAGSTPCG